MGAISGHEAAAGTALVVESDPEVLGGIADALRGAGFEVTAHSVARPAIEAACQGTADVAVVGVGMALEYLATIAKEADHLLPRNIPVVLTAESAGQVTSHPELAMRSSDYVLLPLDRGELLHRVRTAIHRNRLREARRTESAVLRERVRRISDAIRQTKAPSEMVELTLRGIGEALDAEQVMLHIFDDDRISCASAAWRCGEDLPPPANVDALLGELREFGTDLWRSTGSVAVIAGKNDGVPEQLSGLLSLVRFAQSGLLLPIGEGESAFGVLWIVADRGRRKWSGTEIALLQHLLGNLAHGVVQGQLILGQQRVVDRLRELDAAKDSFVATVHHELRTPLSSILGYVELLQDGDGGEIPEPAQKMLQIIERNGQRLSSLIENVLALSVLEATTDLSASPVDMADLVGSAVADLLPLAQSKGICVTVAATDSKQLVSGLRELLERAVVNVLSNAVKFTPEGGSVWVTFMSDDESVRLVVEDTGIGIPEEELPQLLTRFYRASNSVAAEIPGTGLGLAIAAAAVEQHRGTFAVRSSLGSGTTVTIQLPRP